MAIAIESISFRTIIVLNSETPNSKLTVEEKCLVTDVYEHSNYKIKISDKDIKDITEEELFSWCWENLEGNCYVTFYAKEKGNIIGFFEKDIDAMAFKLRWL